MVIRQTASRRRFVPIFAGIVGATIALVGCGSGTDEVSGSFDEVTIENCGVDVTFPAPVENLFVHDSNMVSMVLAIGAADQVAAVSDMNTDEDILRKAYGEDVVGSLNVANRGELTLENVIANKPDVLFAGWNYGYDEGQNLTPEGLAEQDIGSYTLSESCRQEDGDSRGTMSAWDALTTDMSNLGKLTGKEDEAESAITHIETRLDDLKSAPRAGKDPTVFLFDNGTDEPLTSGSFGGPQAIIEAAGAENAAGDIDDTWTSISWERVATADPDFIAFNDYGDQSIEDKIKVLQQNPATRDLPAVQEERFLSLPYVMWTNSPLNIDVAEHLRKGLEGAGLVPESSVEPELELDTE